MVSVEQQNSNPLLLFIWLLSNYLFKECTVDILMHLPRSVFSTRQLDLFLWMLKVLGVDDTPSVKRMNDVDKKLQALYGIQTIKYKGALGHTYYTNSLADIISQVFLLLYYFLKAYFACRKWATPKFVRTCLFIQSR